MSISREEREDMVRKEARKGKSTYQCLQIYYMKGSRAIELTPNQEETKKRISTIHAMLLDAQGSLQIIQQIQITFNVSEATAWNDLRMARKLFGDINKADKDGQRAILYELTMDTYRQAKKEGDIKGMNAAMSNLTKLGGHDRDDPDRPDFDKLTPGVYPILLPPGVEQLLLQLLAKPSVDISGFLNQIATDAELDTTADPPDQSGDSPDP
jgi:hypothetical protein